MIADIAIADYALLAVLLIVAGGAVGLLAGLFGVGGGAIIVPVLDQLFAVIGVDASVRVQLAVGTSLAIIIPTSIRSYRAHKAKGKVDEVLLRQWAIPTVIGVLAGSYIASFAAPWVFKIVFVVVAGANAIRLGFGRDHWRLADAIPGEPARSGLGFGMGVLSALMGIGGGNLCNMLMTLCGRSLHQAVATSAGLGTLISIPGAIGYVLAGWPKMALLPPFSLGFVSLIGAALVFPTSMWLAPYGANLAHRLPKRTLEIAFAVFLTLVSLRFIIQLVWG